MASIQFIVSVYAAYYISVNSLTNILFWWIGTILFSIAVHLFLFKSKTIIIFILILRFGFFEKETKNHIQIAQQLTFFNH